MDSLSSLVMRNDDRGDGCEIHMVVHDERLDAICKRVKGMEDVVDTLACREG